MLESGHMFGGAAIYRRYPIRASVPNPGVPARSVTDNVGIDIGTTTSFVDSVGLIVESATYSTTQADLDDPASDANIGAYNTVAGLDMGRVVTVSIRPDLIIRALMSGGATEGTALTAMTNTSASAGGTTVTAATVSANDMVGGLAWCTSGNNVGHCRPIITHTGSTSFVVTVPFPRAIAVGDVFIMIPYNSYGTSAANLDGVTFVQGTTLVTQADASIASGTGGQVTVLSMDLAGASDSYVRFKIRKHLYGVDITAD